VVAALKAGGIPTAGVRIYDGSGLSEYDRLTVGTLVGILQASASDSALESELVHALPVSGVSGTLRDRLRTPKLVGKVVAKTGTTSIASSLSGYVNSRIAFAIIQNGHPLSYWYAARGARQVREGASDPVASAGSGLVEDRRAGFLRLRQLRVARLFAGYERGRLRRDGVVIFAPSSSSAAPACSRDIDSSVPVITYVLPVSGPSFGRSPAGPRAQPSLPSSSTSTRFCSSANHSTIASARSGPIPSTCSTSSWLALERLGGAEVRAEVRGRDPADVGNVQPSRTRQNGPPVER
jgi:hypothetical protein